MTREEALAEHLGIAPEDGETLGDYIEEALSFGDNEFEAEGRTYLVLTDDEADEVAAEYIKESLWAFNASFLAGETDLPEEVFTALQDGCENSNEAVKQIIEKCGDLDDFISEAISADGRAHFMSSYDGQEHEAGEYYIYRTN